MRRRSSSRRSRSSRRRRIRGAGIVEGEDRGFFWIAGFLELLRCLSSSVGAAL
jgi:hypothetical protein